MTEEELQRSIKEANEKAQDLLQMPPVIKVREPVNNILEHNPALKGLNTAKFVFTDISFGVKNADRLIVVREPDGTLREADHELKDRINQIYFPLPSRQLKPPRMFQEPYFDRLLTQGEYVFVLDSACLQFEPNHPEYQRITSITYQHVNDHNGFEKLRSTRHFGPLAFFLCWFQMIDNLLLELIGTSHIKESNNLLRLYEKVHNTKFNIADDNSLEGIHEYIANYSNKKGPLELAVQAYKEAEQERRELQEGIRKAHGL